jgi:hypothetical protein
MHAHEWNAAARNGTGAVLMRSASVSENPSHGKPKAGQYVAASERAIDCNHLVRPAAKRELGFPDRTTILRRQRNRVLTSFFALGKIAARDREPLAGCLGVRCIG